MRYDIVTLNSSYRGIGRSLNPNDFFSKTAREYYDELISYYFKYIELTCSPVNGYTFNELVEYYIRFDKFGVNCEIIVYDSEPIKDVFGRQIELLGIDVVHDMAESLLEDPASIDDTIKKQLNQFGLCKQLRDVDAVVQFGDSGNVSWIPCWVYRVII